MRPNLQAYASTTIEAPVHDVWTALVDPEAIRKYMFGTNVASEWKEGSPITWKGEWQGKKYEDKGVLLKVDPLHALEYTHFSPMTGLPDRPENYHTVTIDLSSDGPRTKVALVQDNNAAEKERDHSQANWVLMLDGLKKHVEGGTA